MAQHSIYTSMFFIVALLFFTSCLSRAIANQTIEFDKLSRIRAQLKKINKPGVKTIKSPDGDIIDCVLFHDQPAFDLPELKDQKTTLELPELPMGYNISEDETAGFENFQLWSQSGEECPEGTIPILRTTEQDLLRVSNMTRLGKKNIVKIGHEDTIAYAVGDKYYGAKANLNIWAPKTNQFEFSLAQIWVLSGERASNDLNSVEAGWQVYPSRNGNSNPRLFAYWTTDGYQSSGCYNLICPGFVQVNKRITLGAAIRPISSYNGKQFDMHFVIWKDPLTRNWWLSIGSKILIGYWPSSLFTRLKDYAGLIEFGGEVMNTAVNGHTTTQMGSGHFPGEGYKKSAYFRNLYFVNSFNQYVPIPVSNLHTRANDPNCYDIKVLYGNIYGTYFYYGGPGKNPKCP
ncbi:unnamed protein product [Lupinus luteus]|uniref:Neprosin PEP catalytic domain-containing protein n=1 Tax=Lupinus luteus TaxID=3873 RepID=A0AAV1XD05_LUPLU